jgi:GNAT superfamily N-acetyltransferase
MVRLLVERTYLELREGSPLPPAPRPDPRTRVCRMTDCPVSFFRYLYAEVGRSYHWRDRSNWTDQQNRARLQDPSVSVHLLTVSAAPAGYFELQRHGDRSVEIAYLGLLPEFLGRGLGKYLLSEAVAAARALGASRIWLHTCSLDSPAALPNYLARGFSPYKKETYEDELPD